MKDDAIYRQAAIDAFEMFGEYESNRTNKDWVRLIKVVLSDLPPAQPEIIRCKDCIYFDRYVDGIEKYQWDGFCTDWARNTYEDWFCSRAERRTDE